MAAAAAAAADTEADRTVAEAYAEAGRDRLAAEGLEDRLAVGRATEGPFPPAGLVPDPPPRDCVASTTPAPATDLRDVGLPELPQDL